ncbi:M16 family metallopeptidase [Stagnihabitans tardus]|uniref:Insulinase family protein n=1 Tax=Stagnihabitans tardus TaxID=2699202 RepID=A0AAE5BTZ5_9RHOB|nr:pitrilysin family protein [Stagnihabitans tardus]NBZ89615.1 insulinase family protein [Stagnihabitans tardus]
MIRVLVFLALMVSPAWAEVKIQEVTSKGGIKAWLVENHDIAFTALSIRFQGGSSLDAPGKRGAVNLMTALLEEGSGDLDAQGFAAARDALAAEFQFSSDSDGIDVTARFLTENRDQALDLLQGALTAPRFDAPAVERVRGQVLQIIAAEVKDPEAIAADMLNKAAFGDHPYGTNPNGTAESVAGLTRDDLVAAWKGALARDRIYVAAAGDITPEELGVALDKLLGGLPATGAPQPADVALTVPGGVLAQDFPGPQTTILFWQKGLRFDDPDYFAATILNEILGGNGFSSRLMDEVREKRGLTYGIGTGLVINDHSEALQGSVAVANENVAQTVQVIREVWAGLAKDGVTQKELDDTKTYMTGSYPLRFDGNRRIASILVGMQMLGLAPDYPATRNARVEAVTLEDVNRVARELLTPDALSFVVVGGGRP